MADAMWALRTALRTGEPSKRDRGAAALEFALVAPLLVLLTLAAIQFGFIMEAQLAVAHAAGEGARLAAISHVSDVTLPDWQSKVEAAAYPLEIGAGLSVPAPVYDSANGAVEVTVSYLSTGSSIPALVFPPLPSFTLRGKATMRTEYTTTGY